MTSNNSTLFFIENEEKKSIPCSIEKEAENKFIVKCNIEKVVENKFSIVTRNMDSSETDLKLNNLIIINDKNINLISCFNGGNSVYSFSKLPNNSPEEPTTIPNNSSEESTTISNNSSDNTNTPNVQPYNYINSKKSSGGKSTAGILAIIIPCIAVLIIATVVILICKNKSHHEIQNSSLGLTSSSYNQKIK